MKLLNIIKNTAHIAKNNIVEKSPEILLVTGIGLAITGTVMACKATTKLGAILDETNEIIDDIDKYSEAGEVNGVEYTQEDGEKDKLIVSSQCIIKVAKLYGPAIIVGGLSIISLLASYKIIKGRYVVLGMAYTSLHTSYDRYRERVAKVVGEEHEKDIFHDIRTTTKTVEVTDENGEVKTEEVTIREAFEVNDYSKFFDCGSRQWSKDNNQNIMFLRSTQGYFNELLRTRKKLFLNEVLDYLGIPRTAVGQQVGWIYRPEDPTRDSYVDFGIFDYKTKTRDYINGLDDSILLDFNVDGFIMHEAFKESEN